MVETFLESQFEKRGRKILGLTDVQVDRIMNGDKALFVVRDDLLTGGTKERACVSFLEVLADGADLEFVYASPFCGFAQVALARSAQVLGQRSIIFAARDPHFEDTRAHEYTKLAETLGAKIILSNTLQEAHEQSIAYAKSSGSFLVPLGFDHPAFREALKAAIKSIWMKIENQIGGNVRRLWLPVGSGTLAKCLREVIPQNIEMHLVNVNVLGEQDARIQTVMELPNTVYQSAPEGFNERCEFKPEIPSNLHYDAKLWRFLQAKGQDGDLWWNVAR